MTVIGTLAAFVTGAKASALPAAERERLSLHLTDTVIAALAGARIAEGKALQSIGGEGGLAQRIGRSAATIRLTEIDDIHLPSCVTPSAGIVPVALALAAESKNFDTEEIAGAIWVGTELAVRIGLAVAGPKILYRGIWPSFLAAPVAAAATGSRLLALTEAQTGHALSLAFMLMAGGVGRIHGAPSGRWFLYANAVSSGVAAAQAARAGYQGDPQLLEKNWLADTHGIALDREALSGGLAARSIFSELSMKPFCSAKQGIAAVEAFRTIAKEDNPGTAAMTAIRVRVPPAYAGMIATRAEPDARQSTLVSVAHQIALAALAPDGLYDVDRSAQDVHADVARFAAMVEVIADAALESCYPQRWPAAVEVDAAGKTFRRTVVSAAGDPDRPLSRSEVDDKAHRILDGLIGAARVDAWLSLCHGALHGRAECQRMASAFVDA